MHGKKLFFGIVFAGLLLLDTGLGLTAPASRRSGQCLPTSKAHGFLAKKFGETPTIIGVTESGKTMVIYENSKTKSWSIVIFTKSGIGCLIAIGVGLRINRKIQGKPV